MPSLMSFASVKPAWASNAVASSDRLPRAQMRPIGRSRSPPTARSTSSTNSGRIWSVAGSCNDTPSPPFGSPVSAHSTGSRISMIVNSPASARAWASSALKTSAAAGQATRIRIRRPMARMGLIRLPL
jgi:hypothetical protein